MFPDDTTCPACGTAKPEDAEFPWECPECRCVWEMEPVFVVCDAPWYPNYSPEGLGED